MASLIDFEAKESKKDRQITSESDSGSESGSGSGSDSGSESGDENSNPQVAEAHGPEQQNDQDPLLQLTPETKAETVQRILAMVQKAPSKPKTRSTAPKQTPKTSKKRKSSSNKKRASKQLKLISKDPPVSNTSKSILIKDANGHSTVDKAVIKKHLQESAKLEQQIKQQTEGLQFLIKKEAADFGTFSDVRFLHNTLGYKVGCTSKNQYVMVGTAWSGNMPAQPAKKNYNDPNDTCCKLSMQQLLIISSNIFDMINDLLHHMELENQRLGREYELSITDKADQQKQGGKNYGNRNYGGRRW